MDALYYYYFWVLADSIEKNNPRILRTTHYPYTLINWWRSTGPEDFSWFYIAYTNKRATTGRNQQRNIEPPGVIILVTSTSTGGKCTPNSSRSRSLVANVVLWSANKINNNFIKTHEPSRPFSFSLIWRRLQLVRQRKLVKELSDDVVGLDRLRAHACRNHVEINGLRWPVMS